MKTVEVLESYTDGDLDQLAADKVDEVSNLRLPRPVLIHEIAEALGSQSYVASALAPIRPPAYACIKLLLDAPGRELPAAGYREAVAKLTDALTRRVNDGEGLVSGKNYTLYLAMLRSAYENDGQIDRSEALLLEALRRELGIWTREHLLLEHHPEVRPYWDDGRAFERARNQLLTSGLVLTRNEGYVIPEEVALQVRQAWGIALEDSAYLRLLDRLTVQQLRSVLQSTGLQSSGSKEDRVMRVVAGFVPPAEALDVLHINQVKGLCRDLGLQVSAAKADLIESIVDTFETGRDAQDAADAPVDAPIPQEEKMLDAAGFNRLFEQLTVDQLYDLLTLDRLKRAGSKAERIERLLHGPLGETSLLSRLRRADLARTCRRLRVQVSGVKAELVERLIEWAREPVPAGSEEERLAMDLTDGEDEGGDASVPSPPDAPEADVPSSAAPPPAGLRDIQTDFPELPRDEQIILALLRDARSLTERDVKRAAERHRLGWFLIKAHMADLVARLRRQDRTPVRIRSAGATNIYEWVEDGAAASAPEQKVWARDLIDALRHGVVPERHLEQLVVGQQAARKYLQGLLTETPTGRSEFKFLRGPYGSGKTFLCAWLREQAFQMEMAVSTVRVGPDQPISDLPVFFSGLVSGLRTPEKRDASALADVVESWLLEVQKKTAKLENLDPLDPGQRERLAKLVEARISEELARLSGLDPGLAPALGAFYRARVDGDLETASVALGWLRGSRSLPASALRSIGVRGYLESEEVLPRLKALLEVIRRGRLKGLLVLVDELELIRRMPHARQREEAYETLRLLLDETGENNLPGCLLVFTGTDALFDDPRYGMGSYEALLNRVSPPALPGGLVSMRQPVIRLEALDRDKLLDVARSVRRLHGEAYAWPAGTRVPDAPLERLVDLWTSFGEGQISRLPRPILRELVHVLDLCEENPGIAAESCMRSPGGDLDMAAIADVLDA